MTDCPNVLSLPEELIALIMDKCESERDRKYLSLANKQFLDIYKNKLPIKFFYHLQGYTKNAFKGGLSTLLKTVQHTRFEDLKVSKHNLAVSFDLGFPSDQDIFGHPLSYYADNNEACKMVTKLIFFECILTDKSLLRFRILLPNLKSLVIRRCFITKAEETPISVPPLKPLEELCVSLPFMTDSSNPHIFRWLMDCCVRVDKLRFEKGDISLKRPVAKRFYKLREYQRNDSDLNERLKTDLWEEVMACSDKIKDFDIEDLRQYRIIR